MLAPSSPLFLPLGMPCRQHLALGKTRTDLREALAFTSSALQEEAKFCARLAAELQSTSLSASNDVLARDIGHPADIGIFRSFDISNSLTESSPSSYSHSLGIITPYKAQQFLIESALNRRKLQFPVRVATVDSYQGQTICTIKSVSLLSLMCQLQARSSKL